MLGTDKPDQADYAEYLKVHERLASGDEINGDAEAEAQYLLLHARKEKAKSALTVVTGKSGLPAYEINLPGVGPCLCVGGFSKAFVLGICTQL